MQHSPESILVIEHESIFETALACEPGDPAVFLPKKNRGSKISCNCPFNMLSFTYCTLLSKLAV
jgi:hypothetical protein